MPPPELFTEDPQRVSVAHSTAVVYADRGSRYRSVGSSTVGRYSDLSSGRASEHLSSQGPCKALATASPWDEAGARQCVLASGESGSALGASGVGGACLLGRE